MGLSTMADLLEEARDRHAGLGAFNVIHLETAEALVAAAEASGLPVVLQVSQNCIDYHGGLVPIASAMLAIAEGSSASVGVHLDHAEDPELARSAIDLGFGSVMFDGSHLDYAENVAATAEVAAYAHGAGTIVEAELGAIGGKDGKHESAHAAGVRTDPDEAAQFVQATGVDALAVAVGSSHAMVRREASLDLDLIARVRVAVAVPLVLHGSSGVPDELLVAAITAGMTKINVSTHLNGLFTAAIREHLTSDGTVVDSRRYVSAGRNAVQAETARLLRLFALEE